MVYWLNSLLVHSVILWVRTLCSNLLCSYLGFVGDSSLMEEATELYSEMLGPSLKLQLNVVTQKATTRQPQTLHFVA
jgi:hypothetical protein